MGKHASNTSITKGASKADRAKAVDAAVAAKRASEQQAASTPAPTPVPQLQPSEPVQSTGEQQAASTPAPTPASKRRTAADSIHLLPKAGAERKSAKRGTGMERLLQLLSQPQGTTIEEAMEYMGPLAGKSGPLPRGQVMGGIRWAAKGLGWGISSLVIPGRLVLVDHTGERITYVQASAKAAPVTTEQGAAEVA